MAAVSDRLLVILDLQLEGDKEYEAEILLGEETDTLDSTGKVTATAEVPEGITAENVAAVLDPMVGAIWMQVPPIYSALKINGESAYEYARRGEHVEMAPRPVEFREYELVMNLYIKWHLFMLNIH